MNAASVDRRTFLRALATINGAVALGCCRVVAAATPDLQAQPLTAAISLIRGAGGNVVLFRGRNGLGLIDSGEARHSAALLALVDELGNKAPLVTLINTHWHEDHSGGNEAVHGRGARIHAHENTKLWLGAEFDVDWRNWNHQPRPKSALPDQTYYNSTTLDLGGEVVELLHYPQAHTDGDLAVYFPTSNVLVAGGLLADRKYPITDIATGGWIGGLLAANKAMLEKCNESTVIVPERGAPLDKAGLQAQHDMLNDLYEIMKELTRNGMSGHDMLKEKVTAKYDAVWGDPEEFVLETYRGMWAHTYDMGGYI